MSVKFPTGPEHEGKVGPYQRAVDEVQAYIRQLNSQANRAVDSGSVVPLGEQDLTEAAAINKLRSGTDVDRKAFLDSNGQDEMLRLMRKSSGKPSQPSQPSQPGLPLGNQGGLI